jgi:imidazoleglycerol-phosphate dehydratase
MTNRTAKISRKTAETSIELALNLDGSGRNSIHTGVGFLDHMLVLFAKHALVDLDVHAVGDLQVDSHHTTEDVGICLGQAFRECLGDKHGIRRYGHMVLPMEETLVTSAVDFSGRTFVVFNAPMPSPKIGEFDSANTVCNLHVLLHYGRNTHHIAEGIFKATARAIRIASEIDPRQSGVPSSKGVL